MSTDTTHLAPSPAAAVASPATVGFPGAGDLSVIGLGAYTMLGTFYDLREPTKLIGFSATGIGDIFDLSESELEGVFYQDLKDYVGSCEYKLESIDFEAGLMRFTLWSADGKTLLAALDGVSEGFGEAFTKKKKGSLYIIPKDHQNIVNFSGDDSVSSMTFDYVSEVVSDGGTYYGVETAHQGGQSNKLSIDFECKSGHSKKCANWFNDTVGSSEAHMIHTESGDNRPKELYFAFTGVLTIDKTHTFTITLGQGEYVWARQNWHLASMQLAADKNGKKGDLGDYRLEQDGINTFKVKKK